MTTLYPIHTQTFLSKGHNLRRDTEILTAETHKLEALGVVLRNGSQEFFICANNQPLHPHPGRGRKRLYQSGAKRQRAYRDRRHVSGLTK